MVNGSYISRGLQSSAEVVYREWVACVQLYSSRACGALIYMQWYDQQVLGVAAVSGFALAAFPVSAACLACTLSLSISSMSAHDPATLPPPPARTSSGAS